MQLYKIFGFKFFATCFVLFFIFGGRESFPAPCCARNSATPNLIIGDDQSQLGFGVALGGVVAEVFEEGVPAFKSLNRYEISQSYRLDGATILSDRFQVGVGFSLVNHLVSNGFGPESTMSLGDTRISLGYEVLPSWLYSTWEPQAILFSSITIPTGRSKYEAQKEGLSDISGNGFYSLSIGWVLLKRWNLWDAFLIPEFHYSLPRSFFTQELTQYLPGYGASIGMGLGWSPAASALRLGFRLQPRFDEGIKIISKWDTSEAGWSSNCDTGLDASYLLAPNDTLMFSYTDQTLLGIALNSNLSRTFAINFQHRWER